jgi:hypothetical protein
MRRVAPVHPKADAGSRLRRHAHRSNRMLDLTMLALGFGLFAVAVGYAHACERL